MLPGAGDELQGIKRGIMEVADAIFINKADGDNHKKAKDALSQYSQALHLFPPKHSGWIPKVNLGSAIEENGIAEIWSVINSFYEMTNKNSYLNHLRAEQVKALFFTHIDQALRNLINQKPLFKDMVNEILKNLNSGKTDPYTSASKLVNQLLEKG